MSTVGILAFGSLKDDPGKEITPHIVRRLDVCTPFSVEFARYSRTRGKAPTLTPVSLRGAPVKAQLLVLEDTTSLSDAIDMLWRRETRNECTGRHYPASRNPEAVKVKQIHNFQGVDIVLYTDFYAKGKIRNPKPMNLARRAIKSVAITSLGKDGISYLISAKAAGIVTPLMKEYEIEVLRQTQTNSLDAALTKLRKNSPNHDAFDELNDELHEAEEKGKHLTEKGRQLTEAGQFMVDLSHATRDAIHVFKPTDHVEPLIQGWNTYNEQASILLNNLQYTYIPTFNSTGGTAAYAANNAFNPIDVRSSIGENEWPRIKPVIDRLHEITARVSNKEEVIRLMQTFGLNEAPSGKKSPIELFRTAHDAFEKPVAEGNPISTSLIPLRESLRLTIDLLLKERSTQEPAQNERAKIVSIANQLKRDTIPAQTIESWADQWENLLSKYLSPSKEQDIQRSEWQFRLNQVSLFIRNLLSGLDPTKLRSRT